MTTTAKILKLSASGNSLFVSVKKNKFDTVGIAGYVENPNKQYTANDIGKLIEDFPMPVGIVHKPKPDSDEIMCTENGTPLSFLTF